MIDFYEEVPPKHVSGGNKTHKVAHKRETHLKLFLVCLLIFLLSGLGAAHVLILWLAYKTFYASTTQSCRGQWHLANVLNAEFILKIFLKDANLSQRHKHHIFKSGILSTHSRLASTLITLFCHCQSLYDLIHRNLWRHCIHGLCIWPVHQLASWDLSGAQRSKFSDAWSCCPNGEYWLVPRKQPPGTQSFSSQMPGSWREGVCFLESLGNNAYDTQAWTAERLSDGEGLLQQGKWKVINSIMQHLHSNDSR